MSKKEIIDKELEILDRYDEVINEFAKEIICELKKGSTTYKEVNEKLKMLKITVDYDYPNRPKVDHLFNIIKLLLEHEKNDLPLAKNF